MGWLERQREMKLDILESLARSQRAMARIIESAADGAEGGEPAVQKSLHKSIEAIAQYQLAIMEKMVGIRIGEVNVSPPSMPWTNQDLRVAACYGAFDPEQEESTPA
ncbi:MAG: hypothetical protein K0R28_1993 [Paenibacillus sp.]|jgi:hypothetical protein|nr:hypothetical protein [Paenibacillus sp.]